MENFEENAYNIVFTSNIYQMLITETINLFSYCRNPDATTGGIWLVFYDAIVWFVFYDTYN